MKKLISCFCLLLLAYLPAGAAHISGGEMYYRYLGPGSVSGSDRFEITLRLFRDCNVSGGNVAAMPTLVTIGIFRNTSGYPTFNPGVVVTRTKMDKITLTKPYSCIKNPPEICYEIGYFTFTIDLPKDPDGYIASYQTCCRTSFLSNVAANNPYSQNGDHGATYLCRIPGTNVLGSATNSSPVFVVKDTALVCRGKKFFIDFSATDPDGDSLSYSFCSAYGTGQKIQNSSNLPPEAPSYRTLTYNNGFSGGSPLGNNVTIDPETGLISGIAPTGGIITGTGASYFVVNVCITEWKDKVPISEHRKDFLLKVTSCELADAELPVKAMSCDGFDYTFQNLVSSPEIKTYYWDFGTGDISTDEKPTYTFPAAGQYNITLIVNKDSVCTDTAYTTIGVYPGFFPEFEALIACYEVPIKFTDLSSTNYGFISKWSWNFGDNQSNNARSENQHPAWKYTDPGLKEVQLIIESNLGCVDTITKIIDVPDQPYMELAFRDTLICSIDTLELKANGPGVFSWGPAYNIIDPDTNRPLVFPKTTTTYNVTMEYLGCHASSSVKVNVVDSVTLDAGRDTTICLTDEVMLSPITDGLYFKWEPAATLDNDTIKNPIALTLDTTVYVLTASIGKCSAKDSLMVMPVPYPKVDAGPDHRICYDSTVQLTGTITAAYYVWTPAIAMNNPRLLEPYVSPKTTTTYRLTVTDTLGCPKAVTDSVVVMVTPPVPAFAGNDTLIVLGQPLQLNATGGEFYSWTPSLGLNDPNIANPISNISNDQTYIVRVATEDNCYAFDTINIKVFRTVPDIFVPNAFTPNNDGHNDFFRPIAVGIREIVYFHIYNRWGQLVYSSTDLSKGWDGKIKGKSQNTGTYVWMIKAVDYLGNPIMKKGTMTLLR